MSKGKYTGTIITCNLEIFKSYCSVLLGCTVEDIKKYNKGSLSKESLDTLIKEFETVPNGGGIYYNIDDFNFIFIPEFNKDNYYDMSLLTHELFHFVAYALDRIGLTLNGETEEIYAYSLDYLYRQAIEQLHGTIK